MSTSRGAAASSAAMVVLGCKLRFDLRGELVGPAKRRLDAAAEAWRPLSSTGGAGAPVVIVSGGRVWDGVVEADALEKGLIERGVPKEHIVRERCSFHTVDNARFTATLLARRAIDEVFLVTCDWHLPRARRAFERQGLRVHQVPAPAPPRNLGHRVWRWGRERVAQWLSTLPVIGVALLVVLLVLPGVGCKKSETSTPSSDGGADGATIATIDPVEWSAIDRAEDRRRASEIGDGMLAHPDIRVRRRAVRALARIADDASIPGLMRALSDTDDTVVAWAAYGLGYTCKGKEEAHVAALSTRAASLAASLAALAAAKPASSTAPQSASGIAPEIVDAKWAIARALGHCGGPAAESLLVGWVRSRGPWAEGAAYGLGDIATAQAGASLPGGALSAAARLGDESITALLDAASPPSPVAAALYGLGRIKRLPDAFAPRLVEVARGALANAAPSPERIFAVRALAHAGPGAAPELAKIARERTFTAAERAEAARGLGQLEAPGRDAAGEVLAALVPKADPIALTALAGDDFGVLSTLVDAFHGEVPKSGEAAMLSLAGLQAPGELPPVLARRLGALRCAAASAIAKEVYEHELLARCDAKGSVAFERARLAAVVRKPLTGERRNAWAALAKSANLQVREAALEASDAHPELGDAVRPLLALALRSGQAGLAGTAADAIHSHPDRASAAHDARRPDPAVRAALAEALAFPWTEDLLETKIALVEAAAAVGLKEARAAALTACKSPNVTMRQRAAKALATLDLDAGAAPARLGDSGACVPDEAPAAQEIAHLLDQPTKIVLETDAGRLAIVLDPSLAPVTATRLLALARSGFYKGVRVHRVVPGFVAQFGDPGGDGYGGSGRSLRCETSPVPFEPLTVGVATAGRDTGSSQIFVTLSRTPHLDGNYTRVGRAEGDWWAVAQGDVIHDVRVE
ncbi:ElyC/SanA/YdcF family protein [Pendulispora albinea]|uniref:peptidylprolyl isomerase n=1 Tax=Pendulispora albinea TaxID=2741071 RepID=A0ABZ2LU62_9BACT